MREVLGTFAKGCENRVPLYGCSALFGCHVSSLFSTGLGYQAHLVLKRRFEYIQYLHIFLEQMPEGTLCFQRSPRCT